MFHGELVHFLIRLRARRVHGRSLGAVEHAELDGAGVDHLGHFAAQRVDLADDLSLGDAADGGIATHLRHGIGVHGQQRGAQTEPGRRQSRLGAGVAGADDDHVEIDRSTRTW